MTLKRKINLPWWASGLFFPKRYKVLKGGRGSAKSHSVAGALVLQASRKKMRVLCAREFQASMADSVYKLICDKIHEYGLTNQYRITASSIRCKNESEFIFKGVRNNPQSVKSMEGIDVLWLEEAQTISKTSWDILIPTIRKEGSEIWVTFNPNGEDDPTYTMFCNPDGSFVDRPDLWGLTVNFSENPFFPSTLDAERLWCLETDPELYNHIWGGECRTVSDKQVFINKYFAVHQEIMPYFIGPFYGADFGFAKDPSTIVECWIDPKEGNLIVKKAFGGVRIDTVDLPAMYDKISGIRDYMIIGESSRPETINHISNHGFAMKGCHKWEGSVKDGIAYMRSFRKILIDPSLLEVLKEFKNYSHKVDKLTDRVLPEIVDDWNHYIDAIRYALDDYIRSKISVLQLMRGGY